MHVTPRVRASLRISVSTENVKDALKHVRFRTHKITVGIRKTAKDLQQHSQDLLAEGKDRVATVVETGKKVIHSF
jgi:hypothetical protein